MQHDTPSSSATTSPAPRRAAIAKGLRMAGKIAAITGLAAAVSAQANAAPASAPDVHEAALPLDRADAADDLARRVRLGGVKGCGCAPCWGPPAPPALDWRQEAA